MSEQQPNLTTPVLTPLPTQTDTVMSSSAASVPTAIHSPAPTQLPGPTVSNTSDIVSLIDDMRNNDLTVRINAFKHLNEISQALGSQRTRNELIPYLCEFIDDDDEILIVICDWLSHTGVLGKLIGGGDHYPTLFPLLYQLVSTDELNVRTHAISVTQNVIRQLSEQQTLQFIEQQLTQLSTNDWFTARMSATYMYSLLYTKCVKNEAVCSNMRKMYVKLCNDDTPMVRRKAVENLAQLIDTIADYILIKDELLPVLAKLCKDEQDSVRLLCIEPLIHILKYITKQEKITRILPKFIDFSHDKSWRVRYILGEKFTQFLRELGEPYSDEILDCYINLLTDDENEVRQITVKNMGQVTLIIGFTQANKKLFALLKKIVRDTCIYTRMNFAATLIEICTILPQQQYTQLFTELILPNLLLLLKDENYEVKLNTIKQISLNNDILNNNILKTSILPCIQDIVKCEKWRIRKSLLEILVYLAQNLDQQYFNEKILPISIQLLHDSIFAIRISAVFSLVQLCQLFKQQWIEQYIVDKIQALAQNKSYLNRIIALYLIYNMIEITEQSFIQKYVLDILYTLSTDKVKNIQFFTIRILGLICIKYNDSKLNTDVLHKIQQCTQNETDSDVQYYSELVTKIIQQLQNKQTVSDEQKQHLLIHNTQLFQTNNDLDTDLN